MAAICINLGCHNHISIDSPYTAFRVPLSSSHEYADASDSNAAYLTAMRTHSHTSSPTDSGKRAAV